MVVFWSGSAAAGSVGDLGGPFSTRALPPRASDSAARTMSRTWRGRCGRLKFALFGLFRIDRIVSNCSELLRNAKNCSELHF